MLFILLTAIDPLVAPAKEGLFEAGRLWLVRVTPVQVPDHPRLFGNTTLRVDEVLIGPGRLKDTGAIYNFFRPKNEINFGGGPRYSGKYPDFAYPSPKGTSRYWWAGPERKGDGWATPDYRKVQKYVPMDVAELLLNFDLRANSPEQRAQADLVDSLVRLNNQRSRIGQLAILADMKESKNRYLAAVAEKTLKTLYPPDKENAKAPVPPHN
jgi:hypothetical protein